MGRAAFPHKEYPLCSDGERNGDEWKATQEAISERIKACMRDACSSRLTIDGSRAVIEKRFKLLQKDIAAAWGVTQENVSQKVNHPERITSWEADELCIILQADIFYLQHGGEIHYGEYEPTDTIANLYESLDPTDRAIVTLLITRLADDESIGREAMRRWHERHAGWSKRNEERAAMLDESFRELASRAERAEVARDTLIGRGMSEDEVDSLPATEVLRMADMQ